MFVNLKRQNKKLINNALEISKQAKMHKKEDKDVIDGSVGMMFNDNLSFFEFSSVTNVIKSLSMEEKYGYTNVKASLEFEEKINNHLFKSYQKKITNHFYLGSTPTAGGTGAISVAFSNYLNEKDIVLVSDICWENYKNICEEYNVQYETHQYLNEKNQFDRNAFLIKVEEIFKKQDKIVYILNDPCHNPTGFSLTKDDYSFIFEIFNSFENQNKQCVLIYDIAYLDFSNDEFFISREVFTLFEKLNKNTICLIAFSGSKSFSLYGLRIGCLTVMTKSQEERDLFINCTNFSSRTMWSNIASIGVHVIERVIDKLDFENEIKKAREIIKKRSVLFSSLLQENNIQHYCYKDGFFFTLKSDNIVELFEKLKELKVYSIPLKKGLRISLSSVSINEIPELVKRIIIASNY